MSDIVKRLRVWPLRRGYSEVSIRRTMRDAADEIENLRAQRDALREALRTAKDLYLHGSTTSAFIEIRAALGEKE